MSLFILYSICATYLTLSLDENYNWDLVNELSEIDDLEELKNRHKVVMQDLSQKIYDTAILYRMIASMDNEGD